MEYIDYIDYKWIFDVQTFPTLVRLIKQSNITSCRTFYFET